MRHFGGREIVVFLKALDQDLTAPFRLELIGGAFTLICFKGSRGTLDIETTNSVRRSIGAPLRPP